VEGDEFYNQQLGVVMIDSILQSIKDAAGVSVDSIDGTVVTFDNTAFDQEILMHVNAVFMSLRQMGVGPSEAFVVEDNSATWSDFTDDMSIQPMIRSYVTLKVRSLFDPPTSSSLAEAIKNTLAEYEWRLGIECDKYKVEEDPNYAN